MSKKHKTPSKKSPKNKAIQQHHHYLNKIGVKSTDCATFNTYEIDKDRQKRFDQQRSKYGFDERETWNLDVTTAGWIYEHLKYYRKLGGSFCDLTWHKVDIIVVDKLDKEANTYITKLETVTLLDAINIACDYLKYFFKHLDTASLDDEDRAYQKLKIALHIYADIIPYLWW